MKHSRFAICYILVQLERLAAAHVPDTIIQEPRFGIGRAALLRWGTGHRRVVPWQQHPPAASRGPARGVPAPKAQAAARQAQRPPPPPPPQAAPDILLIDGGSSGSKVFAFCPKKHTAKLVTRCRDDLATAGSTNQGIAALAYDKANCEWLVGTESELAILARPDPDYADRLLALLAETYAAALGRHDLSRVKNRDAVPMLATAGMRLISQADNDKVWGYLCGRSAAGLTLAPRGERCGTVPGTTEAYYEFLANAARGNGSRVLTGTFTIGGASAQIAIPLKTTQEVEAFASMRAAVVAELDCTALRIPGGAQAPIFSATREGGPREECVDDYIVFRPRSEIRATLSVGRESLRLSELEGVGLVSFLGLRGSGTFVAGGVSEIQNWAKREECSGNRSTFEECAAKLRKALAEDVLWKHVTSYFQRNALDIRNFSYNTNAAVPEKAGLEGVDGHDQAWELQAELEEECGKDNAARFGPKLHNSCMKALFTSIFITAFFHQEGAEGHLMNELHFDPDRDWAEGKLEEERALLQVRGGAKANALLRVPLRRFAASYVDGAAIHLAAVAGGT